MDEPCPNAETLAAYGDGKLIPSERRTVEKHLATCEDCFELFAGAATFRLEETESLPLTELQPAARRPLRWLTTAAAAAVVLVGVWVVVGHQREQSTAGSEVLALADGLGGGTELQAAAGRAWNGGGAGLGFVGTLPDDKRAFRLGVHLLDARVALDARDGERWDAALENAAALLTRGSESASVAEKLRSGGGSFDDRDERNLDQLAALARSPAPDSFDLGAWAEAGRLAALGGRTKLLESKLAQRLDTVSRAAANDPAVASAVDAIRGALGDHQVSAGELGPLERSFEQLILVHY